MREYEAQRGPLCLPNTRFTVGLELRLLFTRFTVGLGMSAKRPPRLPVPLRTMGLGQKGPF